MILQRPIVSVLFVSCTCVMPHLIFHNHNKERSQHEISSLGDIAKSEQLAQRLAALFANRCKIYRQSELTGFCVNFDLLICDECTSHSTNNHRISSIELGVQKAVEKHHKIAADALAMLSKNRSLLGKTKGAASVIKAQGNVAQRCCVAGFHKMTAMLARCPTKAARWTLLLRHEKQRTQQLVALAKEPNAELRSNLLKIMTVFSDPAQFVSRRIELGNVMTELQPPRHLGTALQSFEHLFPISCVD